MSITTVLHKFFSPQERAPTDRELADLGLSRIDYQHLVSAAPGTRERMEALAARFGVTPAMIDADRGLMLEIAETCGQCNEARDCQRGIDGKAAFNMARCPNASRYTNMAGN